MNIIDLIRKANYIYIIGNGGSASTANHFANDLVKIAGVKAISLCANEAIIMAYANDNGYDNIFIDQLKVFFKKGDLLITFSGSGKSKNIVKAIKWTQKRGKVFSFPVMSDFISCTMQEIEDLHLQMAHTIANNI